MSTSKTVIDDYQSNSQDVTGSGSSLVVAESGTIAFAESSDDPTPAISESGSGNRVTVDGVVWETTGGWDGGPGLRSSGDNFSLTVGENGFIHGVFGAVLNGASASVLNYGTIQSDYSDSGTGLIFGGPSATLENHGLISGRFRAVVAENPVEIVNYGKLIATDTAVGPQDNLETNIAINLTNHGYIHARTAVDASYGGNDDHVINDGRIVGDLVLFGGKDIVDMRGGTIKGFIATGDGDDKLWTDSAKITLSEADDGGTDTVYSSASYKLNDNVEILHLIGKANINGTGRASGVSDELYGNAGDNVIKGMGGFDTIAGGKGDDMLTGGSESDTYLFVSGDGKDTIKGFNPDDGDLDYFDTVDVSQWTAIKNFHDLTTHHLKEVHGDAMIVAGSDSITLVGIEKDFLRETDFAF